MSWSERNKPRFSTAVEKILIAQSIFYIMMSVVLSHLCHTKSTKNKILSLKKSYKTRNWKIYIII